MTNTEGGYVLVDAEKPAEADLRIVLLGKTGAGKSSAGNTILGRRVFHSTLCPSSECQTAEYEGRTLAVVDTPGLLNTRLTEEEQVKAEISRCISLAAPGPHVFLFVIRAGRFTEEEQETVKIIQKMFGKGAARYTVALFTCGDDLEADGDSIETVIRDNPALRDFISQCHGGYHVFNNRNQDRSQVRELLEKISKMVQGNQGKYYTADMLEESQKRNSLHQVLPAAVGAVVVGGVGAGVGAAVGPVGAAVGVAVGAAVGVTVGVRAVKDFTCVTQ